MQGGILLAWRAVLHAMWQAKSIPQSIPQAPHASHCWTALPCCRGDNVVAIDLITEHIRMKLQQHDLRRIYANLEVRGASRPPSPTHDAYCASSTWNRAGTACSCN